MFNRKAIKELKSQIENANSNVSDCYKEIRKINQIQGILVSELFHAKMKDVMLEPCPFCGSKPAVGVAQTSITKHTLFWYREYQEEGLQYSITCSKLDCVCPGIKSTDFEGMVTKWNGRSKENSPEIS